MSQEKLIKYLSRAEEFLEFVGGTKGNFCFDFVEICGGFGGTAYMAAYLCDFLKENDGKVVVFTKLSNHDKLLKFAELCGVARKAFEDRVLVLNEGRLRYFFKLDPDSFELFIYDDVHLFPFEFFTDSVKEEKVVINLDKYATLVSFFRGSLLFENEDLSCDPLLNKQKKCLFRDIRRSGILNSDDALYIRFPGATNLPFISVGKVLDNRKVKNTIQAVESFLHGTKKNRALLMSASLTGFCGNYRPIMEKELLKNKGFMTTRCPDAFDCVRDIYSLMCPTENFTTKKMSYVNGFLVPRAGFRFSKAVFKTLINGLRNSNWACATAFFCTDMATEEAFKPGGNKDEYEHLIWLKTVVAEKIIPEAESNVIIICRYPFEALNLYQMLKHHKEVRKYVRTLVCKESDKPYYFYDENIEVFSNNSQGKVVLIVSMHNLNELRVKAKSVSDVVIVGNPFQFNTYVAQELAYNMHSNRKCRQQSFRRVLGLFSEWNLMLGLWKVVRRRKRGTRLYFMDCSFLRKKNFLQRLRTDFGALIVESLF